MFKTFMFTLMLMGLMKINGDFMQAGETENHEI